MVTATQHIRRMRGGAQSHLMRADDGHFYVVKFQNNPQHARVLINEWIAAQLAIRIGLPVPAPAIVTVRDWLIAATPELRIQLAQKKIFCGAGLQFGARYVTDPLEDGDGNYGDVLDYIPERAVRQRVRNLQAFAGALVFDQWLCNVDSRQVVYWRRPRQRKYTAALVDFGHAFNADEWNFSDSPLRGVFSFDCVYRGISGWKSFQPWLSRIENFDEKEIWKIAETVPPEWYAGHYPTAAPSDDFVPRSRSAASSKRSEWDALEQLLLALLARRSRVRELIDAFRRSARNPFPNWKD